jgi:molybdopterin-containing oxidoreductase family membrane subunit
MTFSNRMFGPYWWSYWALIFCNGLTPQILWFKKYRQSIPALFVVSLIVSVGMWLERFVIIVTSLSQEFMPGMWAIYYPTWVDFTILLGTLGFFTLLFTLFVRFLPAISMAEMRELVHHQEHHAHAAAHH